MADEQPNNPLHGVTLKALLTSLVDEHGWEYLAERVRVQCFSNNPSIKSSLKFLRKTPWAREKVEALYLSGVKTRERKRKRNLRRAARRAYAQSVAEGTAQTFDRTEPAPAQTAKPEIVESVAVVDTVEPETPEPKTVQTAPPPTAAKAPEKPPTPAAQSVAPPEPATETPTGWTFDRG